MHFPICTNSFIIYIFVLFHFNKLLPIFLRKSLPERPAATSSRISQIRQVGITGTIFADFGQGRRR